MFIGLAAPLSSFASSLPRLHQVGTSNRGLYADTSEVPTQIIEVCSGQRISLPSNPKVNDSVFISVDSESLRGDFARILWQDEMILGERDDLILDQMANFLLTYKGKSSGWVIS